MTERKLFIIYNADGGLLNAVRDSFHKTFAPDSYPCALCALAFGFFTVRRPWKALLSEVPYAKVELHRDDFRKTLPDMTHPLPVVLLGHEAADRQVIVSAEEMNRMENLEELIALARTRLAAEGALKLPAK